jgi:hypothetical protein
VLSVFSYIYESLEISKFGDILNSFARLFPSESPLPHKKMLPEGIVNGVERLGA